ncbi:MAG: hypothetical protein ACJAZF_003719, partial [Granulosicoccus sp.]
PNFCCLFPESNYAEQRASDFMKVLVPLSHE